MIGPELITRTLSNVRPYGTNNRRWQYHSRSNYHSSVTCWAVMFDLLLHCELLRKHIADGKVGFGIDHKMRDFQNNKEKCLDLVICRPHASAQAVYQLGRVDRQPITTFGELGQAWGLTLEDQERAALAELPSLSIVPVGMVHVALEAKAAMTEFSKAKSRLFSELDSSITVINGHAQHAVAAALIMVNVASEFRSPIKNHGHYDDIDIDVSAHRNQPRQAEGIIDTVRQLRRRSNDRESGFDAIGIVVVEMKNDGSPCQLITTSPAPTSSDAMHYEQMISRAVAIYTQRFAPV